jgi:hypothetical protein
MKETKTADHSFQITITNELYKRIKGEHSFKAIGHPVVSYAVIGKLIEIMEKRLPSVTLTLTSSIHAR